MGKAARRRFACLTPSSTARWTTRSLRSVRISRTSCWNHPLQRRDGSPHGRVTVIAPEQENASALGVQGSRGHRVGPGARWLGGSLVLGYSPFRAKLRRCSTTPRDRALAKEQRVEKPSSISARADLGRVFSFFIF